MKLNFDDYKTTTNVFYIVLLILFHIIALYYLGTGERNFLIVTLSILTIPIITYPFFLIVKNYDFKTDWFRILYLSGAILAYVYMCYSFVKSNLFEFENPVTNYLITYIYFTVIGVLMPLFVSLPFKIIHHIIFETKYLYNKKYTKEEKAEIRKEELFYETLNETELNVYLKNALQEENYELATKIRNILNEKF
jgi:hypothetical protein